MSDDRRWDLNQRNMVTFVMVNSSNSELTGLSLSGEISKAGGAFASCGGDFAEIGSGWYSYYATAAEADTVGPVAIRVTAGGALQQNLEYVVKSRATAAVEFTYTVTAGGSPVEGATVQISTDLAGTNIIWAGVTNASGVALDTINNEKPYLDPGTYYFWPQKSGITFVVPDTEVVSAP